MSLGCVADVFGVEVGGDAGGAALDGWENGACHGDEGYAVVGAGFVAELLLEIVVQVFIGVLFRRASRKIEKLHLVFVRG